MTEVICLDKNYSTTRLLTRAQPVIEKKPEDKFESMLVLPESEGRQGEGGLRTQGYFKNNLKNTPLITVITVVFNGAETLEKAIKSVVNQSYNNVEYIMIDGGSTDETLSIIKKYEDIIDYWVSESDSGIYDAFNKAVKLAQGEYYMIIGCDDEIFSDSINQITNTELKNNDVDFIVASMFLGQYLSEGMQPKKGWLGAQAMVTGHSVGMIIRTAVHGQIGLYSIKYKLASDALFIKKLFASNFKGNSSSVVMGRFSLAGASNNNLARLLCEGFLIQLETEGFKAVQVVLFVFRLLKNIRNFG